MGSGKKSNRQVWNCTQTTPIMPSHPPLVLDGGKQIAEQLSGILHGAVVGTTGPEGGVRLCWKRHASREGAANPLQVVKKCQFQIVTVWRLLYCSAVVPVEEETRNAQLSPQRGRFGLLSLQSVVTGWDGFRYECSHFGYTPSDGADQMLRPVSGGHASSPSIG